MELGNKIIKLRKERKLTQDALAEKLGVSRQTISNWELNITKPDISQIKKISKHFNISIDVLVDNNVRDIIEKKISNTEKLTNKTTKNLRILIITVYFIILFSVIAFTIYLLINKDFTKDYQVEYNCTLDNEKYHITIETNGKEEIITGYTLIISIHLKDGSYEIEKHAAGSSFYEAINSLKYAKEFLLTQGAKCK